jgi:hypothetical protein
MNRFAPCIAAALILMPLEAIADCGNDLTCAVGAFGQGGVSSGGQAQGWHLERIETDPMFAGQLGTNSGNAFAGRATVGGGDTLTLSGALKEGQTGAAPGNTFRGHGTGAVGNWSGQCGLADFPFECEDSAHAKPRR